MPKRVVLGAVTDDALALCDGLFYHPFQMPLQLRRMAHVFAFLRRVGGGGGGVCAEDIEERNWKGARWPVEAKDGKVVLGDGRHKTRHQQVGRGMQNACLLCVRDE